MSKVCDCCRAKIEAAFVEKSMPIELVEAFIETIEKFAVESKPLPHLLDTVESVIVDL